MTLFILNSSSKSRHVSTLSTNQVSFFKNLFLLLLMYIYYRFIDDAAACYKGIELVTASNCDDSHIIWYFLKHIIYAFY